MVINWSLNIMGYNGNLNSNNRGNRLKKNIFWNMGYDRNKFNTEKKKIQNFNSNYVYDFFPYFYKNCTSICTSMKRFKNLKVKYM